MAYHYAAEWKMRLGGWFRFGRFPTKHAAEIAGRAIARRNKLRIRVKRVPGKYRYA